MNREFAGLIMLAMVMLVADHAAGATICRDGDALTFVEQTEAGKLEVTFCKCMANDLFTFHTVKLDDRIVNSARHSDNIGPFLLEEYGWAGGNHLSDSGNSTARTVGLAIAAGEQPFIAGTCQADSMVVVVTNELLMPDGSVLAIEKMKYLVSGNSIEVWGEHQFCMPRAVTVDRYYGMQSMFEAETSILAPTDDGQCAWVDIVPGGATNSIRVKHRDAPCFDAFVERSADGYQACYMMPEGLGLRANISSDDVVFIGNSYGKSYHKLMGGTSVQPGDITHWHGVYSWFRHPHADTFGADEAPNIIYPAYIGGKPATIAIDGSGHATVTQ